MNPEKRALFLLIGVFVLVLDAAHTHNQMHFIHTATRTTGRVLEPGPGGRHASILFHLPDGTPIQMQSQGLFAAVRRGQALPVLFSPTDPSLTAQVGRFGPLFGDVIGLALIGLVFVLVGLFARG